jgi:hypothetical protein
MAGAGSRFASHLNAELVASIKKYYELQPQRFHFSYVMMPALLRESGSFGTHWMLQNTINVRHGSDVRKVTGHEMVKVIRALHSPSAECHLSADGREVLRWSREDETHSRGWGDVTTALAGLTKPVSSCPLARGP